MTYNTVVNTQVRAWVSPNTLSVQILINGAKALVRDFIDLERGCADEKRGLSRFSGKMAQ